MLRKNCLIIINSASRHVKEGLECVIPYIEHLGIPFHLCDINFSPLPRNLDAYSLFVISHQMIDPHGWAINQNQLEKAIRSGTGVVNFDQTIIPKLSLPSGKGFHQGNLLTFPLEHPITKNHGCETSIQLASPIRFPKITGESLVEVNGMSLMTSSKIGAGRIINWASTEWMLPKVLGPLGGLDDVFWRSLVWAARKPFVMRGLPPMVTMRVDDVAGTGHLWNQPPLFWVHTANHYGFKPWLGLFIYNLTPEIIGELKDLLRTRQATAFPHAFGRPNRTNTTEGNPCPHYFQDAYPLRNKTYDEFIYFDHENKRSWSDGEAARGLQAVDQWYQSHAPLPISPYAIAHWGEMGSNTITHISDVWKCDRIATYHGPDIPLENANWLVAGPFRKYLQTGSALFDGQRCGKRPMYYADFVNFVDRQFFLSCTEIRDDAGYEWAPEENIVSSSGRGIRQLQRAMDSMALPVLFTHETDYVYKISPESWEEQLKRIYLNLAPSRPSYLTLDEGVKYIRATKTSFISDFFYDTENEVIKISFRGETDLKTFFYLFTNNDNDLDFKLVEVPEFQGETTLSFPLKKE